MRPITEPRRDLWFSLVRAGWLIATLWSIGFFVVGLFAIANLYGEPSADARADLARLGLPVGALAALYVAKTLVVGIANFVVAAVIVWHRPHNDMAWLVSTYMIVQGGAHGGITFAVAQSFERLATLALLASAVTGALSFVVLFTFPDGRFVPEWLRLPALAMITAVFVANLTIFHPSRQTGSVTQAQLAVGASCIALGVATQVYRYVRVSRPVQRQETKWVVFGFFIVLAGVAASFTLVSQYQTPATSAVPWQALAAIDFIFGVASLALPLTIAIAILEYRLFDVDVVIRRTLVYGALTATLVAVYFGTVVLLQGLFRVLIGQGTDVAIVASTLAIAALFQPLRHRIQQIIDRRFYRRKYDAARTLAAFTAALRDEVDLTQLGERLTAVVQETMQPTHVALWLRPTSPSGKPNIPT